MALILSHELLYAQEDCTAIIYIDPQIAEFLKEFDGCCKPLESKNFIGLIQCYVNENLPDINMKLTRLPLDIRFI